MKITLKIILFITIIILSPYILGQNKTQKINTDIDYPSYKPIGRVLEYGMIRNRMQLMLLNNDSVNCIVAIDSLDNIQSKHCISNSYGETWSYFDNNLFLASIQYNIYYGPFCQNPTNVTDLAYYNHMIIIAPIGEYIDSFRKAVIKRDYRYYPSNSIEYKLKKTINMDIDVKNSDSLFVYFRDKDSFSLFKIPIKFNSEIWESLGSYASSVSYDKEYPPHKYSEMFSSKNIYENAIKDDLFFEGDFKVIRQQNNRFVFNLQNGRIYIITEKTIEHIGNIELGGIDSVSLKILIEDKDNDEVLVSLPVTWKNIKYPKPQIKILIP